MFIFKVEGNQTRKNTLLPLVDYRPSTWYSRSVIIVMISA